MTPPHVSAAGRRTRASARLGSLLRAIAFSPKQGFCAAAAMLDRRQRAHRYPVEGVAPYVLSAIGGAALVLLWLKTGSLLGLRHVTAAGFQWLYVGGAVLAGGLLGLVSQLAWGLVGSLVLRSLAGSVSAAELRTVWGAAALPQVLAVAVLLPLDVVIAGPAAFTTQPLGDSLSVTWAALSVVIACLLALWSLGLFLRGVEVVSGVSLLKASVGVAVACACLVVVVAGFSIAALNIAHHSA